MRCSWFNSDPAKRVCYAVRSPTHLWDGDLTEGCCNYLFTFQVLVNL